jgi:dipeptidase E
MKVFICGGGDGEQCETAYKRFNKVIDNNKPLLYIPLAMESDRYDSCYTWITNELKQIDVPYVDMVKSADELSNKDLFSYCALFIGGGNTFKLLNDLKASGAFEKIKDYLKNGGVAFGGSAGAIIFGYDLEACKLDDNNDVGLIDHRGYNLLDNASLLCHYDNQDERRKEYLLSLSKHRKCYALPEEVTLFLNEKDVEVIGNKPYYYFVNGNINVLNSYSYNLVVRSVNDL